MTSVAIVIPSFNSADTVGATLASLLAQTAGLEAVTSVYLADDGSRDNTIAAAQAVWKAPCPLRVLGNERNLGQWPNTNRAIRAAGREAGWVLLLHADDLVKPDWLAEMLQRIENCPDHVGSACCSWDTLYPDGSVAPGEDNRQLKAQRIDGGLNAVHGTLVNGCWWHASGGAFRVRAFEDVGSFDPQFPYSGDWEWLLRLLGRGWAVEYIPRSLLVYRRHAASVSSLSFLTNQDIRERARVLRRYAGVLAVPELNRLHLRMCGWLVRRLGGSLVRLSLRRGFWSVECLGRVVLSWLGCLGAKRSARSLRRREALAATGE